MGRLSMVVFQDDKEPKKAARCLHGEYLHIKRIDTDGCRQITISAPPPLVFAIPDANIVRIEAFSTASFLHTGIQQRGGFRIYVPGRASIMKFMREQVCKAHHID